MTNRQENVLIFKDTERMCRNNAKLVEAIRNSRQKQQIFLEKDIIEKGNNKNDKPIEIVVSKKRSLEAAMNYEGKKYAYLILLLQQIRVEELPEVPVHRRSAFAGVQRYM